MKALLLLMTLAVAMPVMAVTTTNEVAGPRVVGNGGGGVRENGVYKTFYSAGLYINPQLETEIPGAELLSDTILTLVGGDEEAANKLLSVSLPMGNRKYYKILESKMDDKIMARLLAEYARIVDQPVDNLTIFAITDVGSKTTYLLPSFYKLSEIEQAAILFHEAYWILNPKADYADVVSAEMEFQKFLELKEAGKYDLGFPSTLSKLMGDPSISLKAAYRADVLSGKASQFISEDGGIKVNDLLFGTACGTIDQGRKYKKFKGEYLVWKFGCQIGASSLSSIMIAAKKYPGSYFLKAMGNYLSQGNILSLAHPEFTVLENKDIEKVRNEILNKKVYMESLKYSDYNQLGYVVIQLKK